MKFLAQKVSDGKGKQNIARYCRWLGISRQGFTPAQACERKRDTAAAGSIPAGRFGIRVGMAVHGDPMREVLPTFPRGASARSSVGVLRSRGRRSGTRPQARSLFTRGRTSSAWEANASHFAVFLPSFCRPTLQKTCDNTFSNILSHFF